MPKVKKNELKKVEKETIKEEVVEVNEEPLETAPIDLNNKPISEDVLKEEPVIPNNFVKPSKKINKVQYDYHNGQKYKVLKNGFGMWANNGSTFVIADLPKGE